MKKILFVFFFTPMLAYAQIAVIQDADGYANVRTGPGLEYSVSRTLDDGTLVNIINKEDKVTLETSVYVTNTWYFIEADGSRRGFVHKSRLTPVTNLPAETQKNILQKNLAHGIKIKASTGIEFINDINPYEQYLLAVSALPSSYCPSGDTDTLHSLLDSLWHDVNRENPDIQRVLAELYLCRPNDVLNATYGDKAALQIIAAKLDEIIVQKKEENFSKLNLLQKKVKRTLENAGEYLGMYWMVTQEKAGFCKFNGAGVDGDMTFACTEQDRAELDNYEFWGGKLIFIKYAMINDIPVMTNYAILEKRVWHDPSTRPVPCLLYTSDAAEEEG